MRLWMMFIMMVFCLSVGAQRVIRKGVTSEHPAASPPPPLYQISDFQGRWQEVVRKAADAHPLAFSDSLQLWFTGQKVYSKDASSMRMSMEYDAALPAADWLIIGTDEFRIKSLSPSTMILADENYLRTFRKMDQFYYETVGRDSIIQKDPEIALRANPSLLKGKWQVYRSFAQPGTVDPQTALISSIEIKHIKDSLLATGEIGYRLGGEQITDTAEFSFRGLGIGIRSPRLNVQYNIYKADGREFIFGDQPRLMFYAKKFSN